MSLLIVVNLVMGTGQQDKANCLCVLYLRGRFQRNLNRALKYIRSENISLMVKERHIELLELKSRLYDGMGKRLEMIEALSELIGIGETIPRPHSKTEEVISRARETLTLYDSSDD